MESGSQLISDLDPQHRAHLAFVFSLGSRGLTNPLQHHLTKRAPHGRKVIGDGRNGNAEFSGQTPVSRFVAFFTEIVALEDAVRDLFAVLVAPALELVDSQGEEIADPLA